MWRFESVDKYIRPIVNADRWLFAESVRIFLGTRQAARLADMSRRADWKRNQRGRWM